MGIEISSSPLMLGRNHSLQGSVSAFESRFSVLLANFECANKLKMEAEWIIPASGYNTGNTGAHRDFHNPASISSTLRKTCNCPLTYLSVRNTTPSQLGRSGC